LKIFEKKIIEPLDKFKPEVILISAGFDAHKDDPLANIRLESKDYFKITKKIVDVANVHCGGKIISFFRGWLRFKRFIRKHQRTFISLKNPYLTNCQDH
jgi:acetoin utilization deacetylase AcuC-like enzyme